MPGEPRFDSEYKNEQHEKAMKAPIKKGIQTEEQFEKLRRNM